MKTTIIIIPMCSSGRYVFGEYQPSPCIDEFKIVLLINCKSSIYIKMVRGIG